MKKIKLFPLAAYLFSGLVIIYVAVYFFLYKPVNTNYSIFKTSPIINKEKIYPGYTLISPYNRLLSQDPKWQGKVYLLDLFGRVVHTWKTKHQAFYSMLKENGNLLVIMEIPKYSEFMPPGGNTGIIQELDWDSNIVWEYKNEKMHHDIVPLKNGNIAVALWEKTPPEIARQVQGGVEGTEINNTIWSDELVEINSKGEVVWSWHAYEHLDPQTDIIDPLLPRYGWTYINGLTYTDKNSIDGQEAFLVSMRTTDELVLIRKKDGKVIWRSPQGMLNTQHDPTFLSNGNILVFDNGATRKPNPFAFYGSRVVEIDPRTNKIVWQFDGGPGAIDKVSFFAALVGGAQRLPNGNTLITYGTEGHIFEVTKEGKIVWDMVSPYTTHQTGAFPNNFLFKSRRYGEDQIKFPKKIAASFNSVEFNLHQILKVVYQR